MTLIIKSECIDVKDGICTTSCPVDCIYEGGRMFYINPSECIECGMCESICPVDAIRYSDEISAEEKVFVKINEEVFYKEINADVALGGWSPGKKPLDDHPLVKEYMK